MKNSCRPWRPTVSYGRTRQAMRRPRLAGLERFGEFGVRARCKTPTKIAPIVPQGEQETVRLGNQARTELARRSNRPRPAVSTRRTWAFARRGAL
jgi:hypothetical protein